MKGAGTVSARGIHGRLLNILIPDRRFGRGPTAEGEDGDEFSITIISCIYRKRYACTGPPGFACMYTALLEKVKNLI